MSALLAFSLANASPAAETCAKNPFNRDTAPTLSIALTDWHCVNCRSGADARAGCPQASRSIAIGSDVPHYWGGWIGGGTLIGGGSPRFNEGTWGWDYVGLFDAKRVFLNWSHGRRYQAGTGAYKTVGPKLHE